MKKTDSNGHHLPYDSREVANYLISTAQEHGDSMSIMRLLKLAYMSHGWTLATLDRPLVNDYVQAWKYGPVIPTIYYAFRPHGIYNLNKIPIVEKRPISNRVRELMETVYELYADLSDRQLTQLTHIPGGPWHTVYQPKKLGLIIENDLISKHFKDKIERSKKQRNDF